MRTTLLLMSVGSQFFPPEILERYSGMPFSEAGGLFECVGHLKDAEILFVAPDNLDADGKAFRCESTRHRSGRISRGRDIPTGFHPIDIARELHSIDLGGIWRVHVERRQLRRRQNEVLIFFEERL